MKMKKIDENTKKMFRRFLRNKSFVKYPGCNPTIMKTLAAKDMMFQIATEGEPDHRTLEMLTNLIRLDGNTDKTLMKKLKRVTRDKELQEDYMQLYVTDETTPRDVIRAFAMIIFAEYRGLEPTICEDKKWKKVFEEVLKDPTEGELIEIVTLKDDEHCPGIEVYILFYSGCPELYSPIFIKTKEYLYEATLTSYNPEIAIGIEAIANWLNIDTAHDVDDVCDIYDEKIHYEGIEDILVNEVFELTIGETALDLAMRFLSEENVDDYNKIANVITNIIHLIGYSNTTIEDVKEALEGESFKRFYIMRNLFDEEIITDFEAANCLMFGKFEGGTFNKTDKDIVDVLFPNCIGVYENQYFYIGFYDEENKIELCSNESFERWNNGTRNISHVIWFKPNKYGVRRFETTPMDEEYYLKTRIELFRNYITYQVRKLMTDNPNEFVK